MKTFLVAALALLLYAPGAYAHDEACSDSAATQSWNVDTSVGVFTSYMWRGFRLYDGASIQPSIAAGWDTGYGIVSANGWMHVTGDSHKQARRFTEFDGTLKYAHDFDPVTVSAGHIWYTYSDYGDGTKIPDTAEFFASICFNLELN